MKKLIFVLVAVFSLAMVTTSCKETKKETDNSETPVMEEQSEDAVEEATEEKLAEVYACPMDCEEGKTYAEAGTCPECKMELKKVEAEVEMQHAEGCKCAEAGECTCEGGKCVCQKEVAVAEKDCTKCAPGACECKA